MLSIYIVIGLLLAFFYAFLIGVYIEGWRRLEEWKRPSDFVGNTSICVLIPARDEARFIEACIHAVANQQYPQDLVEIIVIDDHSTDSTPDLVAALQKRYSHLQLLRLADVLPSHTKLNAYKKKAIELAIGRTEQTLIVTTDADCVMEPYWLASLASYYEAHEGVQLMAAPVCFVGEQTFFQRFQTLDFFGMIISTGASIRLKLGNMCNGANLCYTRAAFYEVGGFKGIDDIASGDDMLLMEKISKRFPAGVHFVKSLAATVYTYPQETVGDFVNQRLRWASKSTKYEDHRITWALGAVFLFNLSLPISLVGGLCGVKSLLILFAIQFLLKCVVDFLYLGSGCRFFQRNELMWLFLPAQPVHILYILIIGWWGNFATISWKGRRIK